MARIDVTIAVERTPVFEPAEVRPRSLYYNPHTYQYATTTPKMLRVNSTRDASQKWISIALMSAIPETNIPREEWVAVSVEYTLNQARQIQIDIHNA